MVAKVKTVAFRGIDAVPVDVQVMVAPGRVSFSIVGLPDKAVAESRERVQAALHASGLSLPPKRITINLAPADLPKEGSHYDVPIALGLMAALGAIPGDMLDQYIVIGELSLDGSLAPVTGTLPAAMGANAMNLGIICPQSNGSEAAWAAQDMNVLAPVNLISLANHFRGTQVLARPLASVNQEQSDIPDLADIKGQETAKRALEIAAAGGHNLLMVGPPGSGKSMLAARLPGIMPPLMPSELLEVSMIASIAGELAEGKLTSQRPFRSPHHSASMAAMVGGGLRAKPGEVSLAHNGILFLDELPEFSSQVLESLRQPIEAGVASIARANHRITYPSRFQLVAAMNPCRCGMAGEPGHTCRRGDRCASEYQARLSGPLLDRIDIRVEVPNVSALDMINREEGEPSHEVANRVRSAREIQFERAMKTENGKFPNAVLSTAMAEALCKTDDEATELLKGAAEKLRFSARAYHRILKVARTVADLEASNIIRKTHIAEAIAYRSAGERLSLPA